MKTKLFITFLIIIVLIQAALFQLRNRSTVVLRIKNMSNMQLSEVLVTVCDEQNRVRELAVNGTIELMLDACSEDHYRFVVKFNNGKTIKQDVGYITSSYTGDTFVDTVIVQNEHIELTERFFLDKNKEPYAGPYLPAAGAQFEEK